VVNVVITGGAGFLGSRLARELLAAGSLEVAGGGARPLSRVTLVDQAPVPPDLAADERVTAVRSDLVELLDPAAGGPDTLGIGGIGGIGGIVELVESVSAVAARTRLLYLYPSSLTDPLVDAILATGVPYFDLSLQHVSRPLMARMRRWGDKDRFLDRIERIRRLDDKATFRSSFILGYPGETEADHDQLLEFLLEAELDWAGFFLFSAEEGTLAYDLPDQVDPGLALERLRECTELQDRTTAERRDRLVGQRRSVLVDAVGVGRTVHEAPEIDGVVRVPGSLGVGSISEMTIVESLGVDVVAVPVGAARDTAGPWALPVGAL